MATPVYYMMERHFDPIKRETHADLEEYLRLEKIRDAVKSKATTNTAIDATVDTSEIIDTTTEDSTEESTGEVTTNDTAEVTFEGDTTTDIQ